MRRRGGDGGCAVWAGLEERCDSRLMAARHSSPVCRGGSREATGRRLGHGWWVRCVWTRRDERGLRLCVCDFARVCECAGQRSREQAQAVLAGLFSVRCSFSEKACTIVRRDLRGGLPARCPRGRHNFCVWARYSSRRAKASRRHHRRRPRIFARVAWLASASHRRHQHRQA